MTALNRREAVKAASVLLGGAVVLGALPACTPPDRRAPRADSTAAPETPVLSPGDRALMESVADTIFPDTPASPGARVAGCGALIELLLRDCRRPADQQRAIAGLAALRARAPEFASQPQSAREALLTTIDAESRTAGDAHWFHLLHELSHQAYYASETGTTQALRYVMEPGGFAGCVPLAPGQPAWA